MDQALVKMRNELVEAEYNAYSPNNFPGSARWRKYKAAKDALDDFDRAHPEILAAIELERKAHQKAKYDKLSDFQKWGS